ncbi:acetyltransferase [Labilibaculum euxinus]|uniref:Transferase n=1 Tax=Labilibaculum euxinus TaxID=2686357 RepID=A0A7M4DAG5_9BACT|nr:acetyltransferase [Labilibaculum euxinus]MUP39644.1 transferase [Labilibaculum euxinus]MVB08849.1 transferase [Labilibaculum euxinus]
MNSKSRLFIIGAGGFGRELELYLSKIEDCDWNLVGYLDDNQDALKSYPTNYQVLGNVNNFKFNSSDYVVLAIANPDIKEKIYTQLKNSVRFLTYIDKTALVGEFVEVGEGSVICPNCIVTTNVKLGCCTILNIGTQIGHDVTIHDYCSLMPNVDIGGCTVIKDKVFIGTNSTVIPSKTICANTIIGAGAIIVKNIDECGTYVGNPAKKL